MSPIPLILAVLVAAQAESPFVRIRAEDESVQAAAVEEFVASCDGCTAHLLGIWRSVDRSDVRVRIAEALGRMGPEGLDALVELSGELNVATNEDLRVLVARALAAHGTAALDAIAAAVIANPTGYSAVFLGDVARAVGVDGAPWAQRVISSTGPVIRERSLLPVVDELPMGHRSEIMVCGMLSEDDAVRDTAAARHFGPIWKDEDRRTDPDGFAAYILGLDRCLGSPDARVVAMAVRTIRAHGRCAAIGEVGDHLTCVTFGAETEKETRIEAARALIAVQVDPRGSLSLMGASVEIWPGPMCIAMGDVDPAIIADTMAPRIVAVAVKGDGEDEMWAMSLAVRLGARSVDPATAHLASEDPKVRCRAASLLGRLGGLARSAEPILLERVRTEGAGWEGEAYARALIDIGADSPEARAALIELIQHPSANDMERYASAGALRWLIQERGDEAWVRELADPVIADVNHPLHEWVVTEDEDEDVVVSTGVYNASGSLPVPEVSVRAIRFGYGSAPWETLRALGDVCPATPQAIEIIREHFSDIRPTMVIAAIDAACRLGPDGVPLIDDLIRVGRESDRRYRSAVEEALLEIAPKDPRVLEFGAWIARGAP